MAVHDFFEKQPIQAPEVFFVRTICHDWSDDLLVNILGNLRAAAGENTKLIIAEYIIPYACPKSVTAQDPDSIVEADSQVPLPLLSNLGKAGFNAYFVDMTVCFVHSHILVDKPDSCRPCRCRPLSMLRNALCPITLTY